MTCQAHTQGQNLLEGLTEPCDISTGSLSGHISDLGCHQGSRGPGLGGHSGQSAPGTAGDRQKRVSGATLGPSTLPTESHPRAGALPFEFTDAELGWGEAGFKPLGHIVQARAVGVRWLLTQGRWACGNASSGAPYGTPCLACA